MGPSNEMFVYLHLHVLQITNWNCMFEHAYIFFCNVYLSDCSYLFARLFTPTCLFWFAIIESRILVLEASSSRCCRPSIFGVRTASKTKHPRPRPRSPERERKKMQISRRLNFRKSGRRNEEVYLLSTNIPSRTKGMCKQGIKNDYYRRGRTRLPTSLFISVHLSSSASFSDLNRGSDCRHGPGSIRVAI